MFGRAGKEGEGGREAVRKWIFSFRRRNSPFRARAPVHWRPASAAASANSIHGQRKWPIRRGDKLETPMVSPSARPPSLSRSLRSIAPKTYVVRIMEWVLMHVSPHP